MILPPKVEILPLDRITPDPANVRYHTQRNKEAVHASVRKYGAGRSIVLDGKNTTVAGNQSLESFKEEGFQEAIIVEPGPGQIVAVRRPDWTPSQATAYAIMDNRSADLADWDGESLQRQIQSLETEGIPMGDLGFTAEEYEALFGKEQTLSLRGEHGDEAEGFASSEQFKEAGFLVLIPLSQDQGNSDSLKADLSAFCERWGLEYKIQVK